jgi:formylglycine-generating enzyme required for sulfatase activity
MLFFVLLIGFGGRSVNNVGRYLENVQGMVFVEGGTFILGQSDSDSTLSIFSQLSDEEKKVSITSFYMDEGEVTNKQYREFVKWVRDSIAISNYLDDNNYFLPGITSTDRLIDWPKVTKGSHSGLATMSL